MEDNVNGKTTQGVDLPPVTIENVEKWLTKDLGSCISMLNAIYNDPNLRHMLAEYLVGVHHNRLAGSVLAADLVKGPKAVN